MPDPDATSRLDRAGGEETVEEPLTPVRQPHRLIPYLEAAALAFLGLLCLGAFLLVAVKLQYTQLGAGAAPVEILTSIVILSLAILRVPVHVGDVTFTVLPLGALMVVALIVRWACRSTVRSSTPRRSLWIAAIFAAIAAFAALAFRHRFEPDAIYAGAPSAFLLGGLWTALFVGWFFLTSREGTFAFIRRVLGDLRTKKPKSWETIATAGIMLAGTGVMATAGGLLWVIVALLRGDGPQELEVGGLVAAVIYVAAFAPNLVVAATALSLGAPLEVGAALTVGGRVRGNLQELSVVASEGVTPALLLLAVPVLACAAAGYWAAKNSATSRQPLSLLVRSSFAFAGTLTLLSWLGEARLGAELATERGFGVVAPDGSGVFVLALVWSFVSSLFGWTIAQVRS